MADQDPAAVTPGSSSTGPRLAHDLRAIREARKVSLDDVQRETRMPSDILRRFEAGELVNDPHYNEVYLRNLLRSYAQALGISPQEVSNAYEKAKKGDYDGELRRRYVEGKTEPAPPKPAAPEPPRPETPPASKSGGTAPAVAALSTPPKKAPVEKKAAPSRPSEPLPKHRVQSATAASQPIEKSWGLIIGGTVVALVAIGLVLWLLFREPGPEPEVVEAPPPVADTTAAEQASDTVAAAPVQQVQPGPRLQTPIQVTVIASGGSLQGFRVTEGDDARRPYWLEEGNEQTFQSDDQVTIWGEGSDESYGIPSNMRLRLQGIEWDPQDGQVLRIDQQRGQALLDSLSRVRASGATG